MSLIEEISARYLSNIPLKRAAAFFVFLYLLTSVVDGPLRYMLFSIGLAPLIYIRDLFLLLSMVLLFYHGLTSKRMDPVFIAFCLVTGIFAVIGVLVMSNVPQILFGIKLFLPFIAGLVLAFAIGFDVAKLYKPATILLIIAVIGGLIDYFGLSFWRGLEYEVLGNEVEGTKDGATLNFIRINGFSRNNFELASQIFVFLCIFLAFCRGFWRSFFVWLLAAFVVSSTISKGLSFSVVAVSMIWVAFALFGRFASVMVKPAAVACLCLTIGLPLLGIGFNLAIDDPIVFWFFASFIERMEVGWPASVLRTWDTSAIVGMGIGSAGAADMAFGYVPAGAGDNMFVLIYGWFGVLGVGYMMWTVLPYLNLSAYTNRSDFAVLLLVTGIWISGLVTTVVESAILGPAAGFAFAYLHRVARRGQGGVMQSQARPGPAE